MPIPPPPYFKLYTEYFFATKTTPPSPVVPAIPGYHWITSSENITMLVPFIVIVIKYVQFQFIHLFFIESWSLSIEI